MEKDTEKYQMGKIFRNGRNRMSGLSWCESMIPDWGTCDDRPRDGMMSGSRGPQVLMRRLVTFKKMDQYISPARGVAVGGGREERVPRFGIGGIC